MRKDPIIFLEHIRDQITDIREFTKDVNREEFMADKKTQKAVVKCLETIGEAIRNLPEEFLQRWQDVPWKNIMAFRNILVHEYFDVDFEYVWKLLGKQLDELENQIESIVEQVKV
ncbi:MAG: hypothetical protein UX80_C0034G0003 [Candidatus Amesbacteria bacterium GW2011_GWA2_47_11b]|uniref:Nucleotidyltransferase n=2 Tax=Candidatus Amesiibacteriota TaxID=1752730 RepID=A0A0G1RGZ0_9BACT|nr:MAG: hypothetical protein UX80_C0034G0003 [Candidatus Amesbacteria bacterium GW2011_GWA2_47_11b]KKU82352.1 MAG: hypothetical protein UY11_C0050G0007 [Candidatus Amesbacteria bacterium GW2011_GWC2_47_8]